MVARAYGHALLIKQHADIMRMRTSSRKLNDRQSLFGRGRPASAGRGPRLVFGIGKRACLMGPRGRLDRSC